jgi:transposase
MVVLGIDTHKRTHTVVAVDEQGREIGQRTIGTTSSDHLEAVAWADQLAPDDVADQVWAVEDCRHLSRRLERDLLTAGRRIVRVHPKLMRTPAMQPAVTASPIPSTHWRWLAPR